MRIRALDKNGDWSFGKGRNNYLSGEEAIVQNLKCRLNFWQNDCFFAMNDGIDYVNEMDKGQQIRLEADIRQCILNSYGITAINSYSSYYDPDLRTFKVVYDLQTFYNKNLLGSTSTNNE